MTGRREFLQTTGALAGVGALSGLASAESTWDYELVSEALDAGSQETVVQGDWAYTANGGSIATVDLSDPATPLLGGTAAGHGIDNADVKVDGDLAGLANDGTVGSSTNPAGVTFFDVSDPTSPTETTFYDDVDSGIHNMYIEGEYAYLCINESGEAFASKARTDILDVSDPTAPTKVGEWRLKDHHPGMATAGINPLHDVYVQDDLLYQAFWDAGVVVADVTDPTDPTAVAHFGATDDADVAPGDNVEFYQRYLGQPGNAHYVQPSPDGDLTFVGAETFPGPFEDTVIPGDHGGIRVFDTSDVSTTSTPGDPRESHIGYIDSPEHPTDATDPVTTAHNFDVTDSKLFASFYQGGIRAFDVADPTNPNELAAKAPVGTAYWTAVDLPSRGKNFYTVGSDIGKGLTVLELDHDTAADDDDWTITEDLDPRDLMGPTMEKPL